MAVSKTPVMGLFRHAVDGAHAAQRLREKGFSRIAICPVAEWSHGKGEDAGFSPRMVTGIAMYVAAVFVIGWITGHAVNRAIGVIAAMTTLFLGMLGGILFLDWGTTRVKRYPRDGGVRLTVECRSGEEPEVAETLRHAGAVQIQT